jgi:hypothetical protein
VKSRNARAEWEVVWWIAGGGRGGGASATDEHDRPSLMQRATDLHCMVIVEPFTRETIAMQSSLPEARRLIRACKLN